MQPFSRLHEQKPIPKSSAPPHPLDTGTPDDHHDHNTLLSNDLRQDHPVSKPWTPDHWMKAISLNPGISYDELSGVQAWTPDAFEPRDAASWRWGLVGDPNQGTPFRRTDCSVGRVH